MDKYELITLFSTALLVFLMYRNEETGYKKFLVKIAKLLLEALKKQEGQG